MRTTHYQIMSVVGFLACIALGYGASIMHPEKTSTQIFLEYGLYLLVFAAMAIYGMIKADQTPARCTGDCEFDQDFQIKYVRCRKCGAKGMITDTQDLQTHM